VLDYLFVDMFINIIHTNLKTFVFPPIS